MAPVGAGAKRKTLPARAHWQGSASLTRRAVTFRRGSPPAGILRPLSPAGKRRANSFLLRRFYKADPQGSLAPLPMWIIAKTVFDLNER